MFDISSIGIFTVLAAGAISFLSPCVLPVVPAYVSYIAGNVMDANRSPLHPRGRLSTLFLSLCFVLGFSTIFVTLGASATALSRLLLAYRYEANIIGGAIIILFGVFMIGVVRLPWLERDMRYHGPVQSGRPLGAYVLGLAFGFGWTPCIGPVLGAILTISAVSATASSGVVLLSIYSIGLGLPFLFAALFTESLALRLKSMRKGGRVLQIAAGVIMVAMGLAMITGQMSIFAFWLLERFPILGTIG